MGIRALPAISVLGLAAALLVAVAQPASADPTDDPPTISLGEDGVTASVFGYADAIRERVFIPVTDSGGQGVDQDGDGQTDRTAIEIIRPSASDAGLKVPVIIEPSPYYSTVGRGNETEKLVDVDDDGIADKWPLFYDNYFVPRGYAVILAEMDGTTHSTGCPMHGSSGDIASMRVVVDWLQGRVRGYDASGAEVVADWDNGKAAMIGKSYDGTLANGVAATGVAGLTTIVPLSAISDWYSYSRTGGIRTVISNYPAILSNNVTDSARQSDCAASRDAMSATDGDDTGDRNAFWDERDYLKDAGKVTASVFAVHGINDDNVQMEQFARWWEALAENDVPRKVWLSQEGHTDPFDFRREEWVDTLHRWFDYWLQGIDNGVMGESRATIETAADVWEEQTDWPLPGTEDVQLWLGVPGTGAGRLTLQPDDTTPTRTFTDLPNQQESAMMASPEGSQANRLVFLSEPLETDLRISGTPMIDLYASLDKAQSNLGAVLVDYGTATRVTRTANGINTISTEDCWGEASTDDDACYKQVEKVQATSDAWRVSRGILDSANRESLYDPEPVVEGEMYRFRWSLVPTDYTFKAGHQIGIVLVANYWGYSSTTGAQVTVDTTATRLVLPVVGGAETVVDSAGFGDPGPVTLDFDLGGHGAAIPAQQIEYGDRAAEPEPAPTETGWIFDGWFTDTGFGTPFDFDAPRHSSATAYARWTRETHQVSFELAGHGAAIDAQTIGYGGLATEPDEPEAAGWVFRGWYTDAGLNTSFDFTAPVTSDRAAYAAWSAVTAMTVAAAPDTVPAEGREVSLVARVTTVDPDAPSPQGSLRFLLDGSQVGAAVAVGADGYGSLEAPAVAAGDYVLRAEFVPDAGWEAAAGEAALQVAQLIEVVRSMNLTVSATAPRQGDTITVDVEGFDEYGVSLGAATSLAQLSSSVASDVVQGNTVTFLHASPHVITAVINTPSGQLTAQILVEVSPAASHGTDQSIPSGSADPGSAVPPLLPQNPADPGHAVPQVPADTDTAVLPLLPPGPAELAATGNTLPPLLPPLGAVLVLLGAALVWRSRSGATTR